MAPSRPGSRAAQSQPNARRQTSAPRLSGQMGQYSPEQISKLRERFKNATALDAFKKANWFLHDLLDLPRPEGWESREELEKHIAKIRGATANDPDQNKRQKIYDEFVEASLIQGESTGRSSQWFNIWFLAPRKLTSRILGLGNKPEDVQDTTKELKRMSITIYGGTSGVGKSTYRNGKTDDEDIEFLHTWDKWANPDQDSQMLKKIDDIRTVDLDILNIDVEDDKARIKKILNNNPLLALRSKILSRIRAVEIRREQDIGKSSVFYRTYAVDSPNVSMLINHERSETQLIKEIIRPLDEDDPTWTQIVTFGDQIQQHVSHLLATIGLDGTADRNSVVHADPDEAKLIEPEYNAGVEFGIPDIASVVHETSRQTARDLLNQAIQRKSIDRIVYDSSGQFSETGLRGPSTAPGFIKRARENGFAIDAVYFYTDPETIKKRIEQREENTGRSVPPGIPEAIQANLQRYMPDYIAAGSAMFDTLRIVDTNQMDDPELIYQFTRGMSIKMELKENRYSQDETEVEFDVLPVIFVDVAKLWKYVHGREATASDNITAWWDRLAANIRNNEPDVVIYRL